jgi:hypothetical protein
MTSAPLDDLCPDHSSQHPKDGHSDEANDDRQDKPTDPTTSTGGIGDKDPQVVQGYIESRGKSDPGSVYRTVQFSRD